MMPSIPQLLAIAFLMLWALCAANKYREELRVMPHYRDTLFSCVLIGLGQALVLVVIFALIIGISYIAAGGMG